MSAQLDVGRRVLLVAASNRRRGAEVVTTQLRDALTERGWKVDAVALTAASDSATVDLDPITSVSAAAPGRLNRLIFSTLRNTIKATSPDLVVAMGGSTLRYAALATSGSGPKLVYFAIGEPNYWLKSPMATFINRALYRRVDRVIAVSRMTADQLVDLEPALDGRVDVAYTGVDDVMFEVAREKRENGLRVVFVGSLSREKDPLLAISAIARVPSGQLRLVGSGPMESEVRESIRELGVEDRVELVGPVNDVTAQLAWADLLLLTSRTEGLPGVVLEAAAAGVPTVGVDVGGVAEAIVDGVTGLVVSRDSEQIAAAIARLTTAREQREAMGIAARDRAQAEFRLDHSADRFEAIFEGVLA